MSRDFFLLAQKAVNKDVTALKGKECPRMSLPEVCLESFFEEIKNDNQKWSYAEPSSAVDPG